MSIPLAICLCCLLVLISPAASLTINIGVFLTRGTEVGGANGGKHFENVASAFTLAVEDYQAHGGLTDVTFRYSMGKMSGKNAPAALKAIVEVVRKEKPDVSFGPSGTSVVEVVGRYLGYWDVPYFPHAGANPLFSNKNDFTTLVRIFTTPNKMGGAFPYIFKEYGWRHAAIVSSSGGCDLRADYLYEKLTAIGVTIGEWIRPDKTSDDKYILEGYLDRIRERARIVVVCFHNFESELTFLRLAHTKNMKAPEYTYISLAKNIKDNQLHPWTDFGSLGEHEIDKWRQILIDVNYKRVTPVLFKEQKHMDFFERIPVRLTQSPWYYNLSLEMGWKGSFQSMNFYDATLTYLDALNETLMEGGDYKDGKVILNKIRNRIVFSYVNGKMKFDENADRDPDFWVLDLRKGWQQFKPVIHINPAEPEGKQYVPMNEGFVYWGTEGNRPPSDIPACGFKNELCPEDKTEFHLMIGLLLAGSILIICIILVVSVQRHQRALEILQQTVWRINFSDIAAWKRTTGSEKTFSEGSMQSAVSDTDVSNNLLCVQQMFTEVGVYRKNLVAIRRVKEERLNLTKTDLKELTAMMNMSHDNLAIFIGACVDTPNICYITLYYRKGSLQDIIENELIGLDWMFKSSLLSDLAEGMAYLHKSDLGSHGSLKSSCCLVDSRWQLKVSSFGLHAFRSSQLSEDEDIFYRSQLWTAPELLRIPQYQWPRYGNQKGDVYSFGVIAQEVIYRASPYFILTEPPRDIIVQLATESTKPFRRQLPKVDVDIPKEATTLIELSWEEEPSKRPTFEKIQDVMRNLNHDKEVDIMSSMIEKLEKYANNLEDIVSQRTAELVLEKQKTDALLYRMLPESVAEQLKNGQIVEAELFEAVTVLFSDIVGFTPLSLESSPLDIVNLLNDLYSKFDEIIYLHNVYKVETISDSYMVVSGLPHRNGDKHVGEIANLALDLMSAACDFKIRHRPELKLQLRIGFHTGPCAAGVVGLSMPRYCLFGDTVNMASRMETNGKALHIHMSMYAFAALKTLEGYKIRSRGEMQIKGKGLQMTYWLLGKHGFDKKLPPFTVA